MFLAASLVVMLFDGSYDLGIFGRSSDVCYVFRSEMFLSVYASFLRAMGEVHVGCPSINPAHKRLLRRIMSLDASRTKPWKVHSCRTLYEQQSYTDRASYQASVRTY